MQSTELHGHEGVLSMGSTSSSCVTVHCYCTLAQVMFQEEKDTVFHPSHPSDDGWNYDGASLYREAFIPMFRGGGVGAWAGVSVIVRFSHAYIVFACA